MIMIMIMRVDGWFREVTGAASSRHASLCLPITLHRHHPHHHCCHHFCHQRHLHCHKHHNDMYSLSRHASPCLPITLHRHHRHNHFCHLLHCHHCHRHLHPIHLRYVFLEHFVVIVIIIIIIVVTIRKSLKSIKVIMTILKIWFQGQNVKLKTENLVLKSKFGSKTKMEPTSGSLSPPYSNPSNSPQRQVSKCS